ncbi:MAG: hypothetical protein IJZ13_03630 [Clostridia bacterium]|nr:hypothetical protein [Clostridia bacterium]
MNVYSLKIGLRRVLVLALCCGCLLTAACAGDPPATSNDAPSLEESDAVTSTGDGVSEGDVSDDTAVSDAESADTAVSDGTTQGTGDAATSNRAPSTEKPGGDTTAKVNVTTTQATTKATTTTETPEPENTPRLVTSGGETYVVDVYLDESRGVDPTGKVSSAGAIQDALSEVSARGGGTVYLPAGNYLLEDRLSIPAFTTLLGDWKDPDKGESGGTVLMIPESYCEYYAGWETITLFGSAGAIGLTIYYPDQRIDNVKEYPAVFNLLSHSMLQTVKNVCFINAYKGILYEGYSMAHEMLTVDNVKGTVLNCGAEVYNQADVGTWRDVTFNATYWANAKNGMNTAKLADIEAYTRQNAVGIRAGDLEWTEFLNIRLSDFKYGFQVVPGRRIEFAGSLYNAVITDCDEALCVESIDTRWGMLVADSTLEGSDYAVNYTANTVNNLTNNGRYGNGVIKMCGVKTTGKVTDNVTVAAADLSSLRPADATHAAPASRLFVVEGAAWSETDASAAIQKQLDAAGKAGGGIVYLPSGCYVLEKAISVPAGVELRGSSSSSVRGVSGNVGGTIVVVKHGQADAGYAEAATATITLKGKNAGVRGIQMVYPAQLEAFNNKTFVSWTYAIRGKAEGVYAVDVCLAGAYNGIDFRDCDNHYIRRAVTCCVNNAFYVGGKNGVVEDCLQNATVVCRMGSVLDQYTAFSEANVLTHIFDPVTRPRTVYIQVGEAENQRVTNTFAYGVHTLVKNVAGENTVLCNVGADNIGGVMLNVTGGSLYGVNIMRWNGSSYTAAADATVHLYNRLTIHNKNEENF